MARFDKVDPKDGSYRARLGFAIPPADVGIPKLVSIDTSGVAQLGTGGVGAGVIVPSSQMAVGEPIDVMTDGEVVDVAGLTAGVAVTGAAADGAIPGLGTDLYIGHTVEAWRLIVRVNRPATGA